MGHEDSSMALEMFSARISAHNYLSNDQPVIKLMALC